MTLCVKIISMNILISLLLVTPILLEPFPISSSGHALLLEQLYSFFHLDVPSLPAAFDHWLHGPTAVATLIYFFQSWLAFLLEQRKKFLLVAFSLFIIELLTVRWYVLFSHTGMTFFSLPLGFFITALLLLSLLFCPIPRTKASLNIGNGSVLGMVQGISLLPGISRFGSTFVVARWCGFSSQKAFELSFLIEFPISVAAFLKGSYILMHQNIFLHELLNLISPLVMVIAVLSCYGGLWLINGIIKKNCLWMFGIYMLFITAITTTLSLF